MFHKVSESFVNVSEMFQNVSESFRNMSESFETGSGIKLYLGMKGPVSQELSPVLRE
jgi:hypothetical protein